MHVSGNIVDAANKTISLLDRVSPGHKWTSSMIVKHYINLLNNNYDDAVTLYENGLVFHLVEDEGLKEVEISLKLANFTSYDNGVQQLFVYTKGPMTYGPNIPEDWK